MKDLRTRLLLIICTGLMGLLAACGDSAATPTVVAPTATTAASAEATATTATMPEATATTATMPEATATTATMPEATAAMPAATATTGGGSTTGLPAALQSAAQAMQGLKSYHFSATTDMGATGSTSIEGDVVLPDKMSMTSTANMAGQTVKTKMITIGSTVWTNAGGQWIKTEGMPVPMNPTAMTSGFSNVTDAEDLGDATLDGMAVHHLRYKSADATGAGTTASEIWIDKATNHVVQVKSETDSAAGKIAVTVKFSRFNDPSIVIEEPQ